MLALVFRGIFLISVLSWYSSSVWKMIDGYFKDKFHKYLQEEYERNPRMRADVDAYGAADKKAEPVLPTVENIDGHKKIIDLLEKPTCSLDQVNSKDTESRSGKDMMSCSSENKVAKVSIDKNALLESTTNSTSAKNNESLSERNAFTSKFTETPHTTTVNATKSKVPKTITGATDNKKKSGEVKKKKLFTTKIKLTSEPKKKLKVKIITLTDADFESAKSRRLADDDFSEFDVEDGKVQEVPEGVLVSELPFKPKADIGDLERVSPEEYCPLTIHLEDELNCGETRKWP